ncbi:MAG: hypothetical protein AB7V08_14980 [Elusimicrobiales bacterium]
MAKKLARSTVAKKIYEREAKGAPVGTGQRFRALTKALAYKGAKNPRALAAWIGRQKYGKKRFQQMAAAGRRRAARKRR